MTRFWWDINLVPPTHLQQKMLEKKYSLPTVLAEDVMMDKTSSFE